MRLWKFSDCTKFLPDKLAAVVTTSVQFVFVGYHHFSQFKQLKIITLNYLASLHNNTIWHNNHQQHKKLNEDTDTAFWKVALVWLFSLFFTLFFEFHWNLMYKNSHSKSKEGHKNRDVRSHSLYSTHIRRWNLLMSDCRAQDDSVMKTFPPTSTTTGSNSSYIKTLFFPILFMSPSPILY